MQAWTPRANSPWGVEFHGRAQNSANSVQAIHRHHDTAAIAAPSTSARIFRDLRMHLPMPPRCLQGRHHFFPARMTAPSALFAPNSRRGFTRASVHPFADRGTRSHAHTRKRAATSCVCLGKRRRLTFPRKSCHATTDNAGRHESRQRLVGSGGGDDVAIVLPRGVTKSDAVRARIPFGWYP